MTNNLNLIVLATAVLFGSIAASQNAEAIKQTVQDKYYEIVDKDTVALSFDKDNADLKESEKSHLKSLVETMKNDEGVQKFIVAAWADDHYPASDTVRLPKNQLKLADNRKSTVARALKDLGVKNVDTYSMAKRPNWIAKTFSTSESKIKGTSKGDDKKNSDQILVERLGDKLKSLGGPGKVVVIVKR